MGEERRSGGGPLCSFRPGTTPNLPPSLRIYRLQMNDASERHGDAIYSFQIGAAADALLLPSKAQSSRDSKLHRRRRRFR